MQEAAIVERAPHVTSALAERVGRSYLVFFLLIPLLGYLLPFAAERITFLQPLAASQWGRILDSGYDLQNQNADVLIFGDSTALFGADTLRLSQDLGLKVVNLPGTIHSLSVTGDRPLREYLADNRPPRLIVFYFAPWNLDFHADKGFSFEGQEQMLRHEPLQVVMTMARKRPLDMLSFPFQFYSIHYQERKPIPRVHLVQGHTPYPATVALDATCSIPARLLASSGSESVKSLARAGSEEQIMTLVYLAPIPDCVHAAEVQAASHPGIDVAGPAILSHEDFAADHFYVHTLERSEAETSDLLARAIRTALAK